MTDQVVVTSAPIPPLIHAIGGSAGGALTLLLLYPLERARIEMQKIVSEQSASVSTNAVIRRGGSTNKAEAGAAEVTKPSSPVFTGTEAAEEEESWSMGSSSSTDDDVFQDALTSERSISSQDDNKLHLLACLQSLWQRNELYRGVAPVVITTGASNFVFFFINEFIKGFLSTHKNVYRRSNLSLLASCLAGICNVLATNPLWVANLRIVSGESKSRDLWQEMFHVARKHGLGHLWAGTRASLLLVSNPIIQFFLYEELKVASKKAGSQQQSLAPVQAFVLGALAKTVATIVTYPLQLTQAVLRMSDDDLHYEGTWDCLRKVYKRDGTMGLFTGMRAKLLQTVLTSAFTFLTYEQIIEVLHSTHQSVLAQRRRNQLLGTTK